ncbi:MAG TPA: 2'-5' RNA ligase family protein [Jatrophihabitantaceae bacterium]|jgi:2'-5' RNA ligase
MAIAVVVAGFDPETDERIAEFRAMVRSLGGRAPVNPANRPHLTLTAASVDDPEVIVKLTRRIARRHAPMRLRMLTVGSFGRGDVVWLGPRLSAPLKDLQRDVYATLVDAGHEPAFAGQSDPRGWRPHCTIARQLTPAVLGEVEDRFRAFNFTVDALATIVVGGHGDVGYAPLKG